MTNPPPSLSPRQREWLRRGAVALVIYVVAVLMIVPWENVGLMLAVPGYPLFVGLVSLGWMQLCRSRVGRCLLLILMLMGPVLSFVGYLRYKSLVSELSDPNKTTLPSTDGLKSHLWMLVAWLAIGCVLSVWGWVLHFRRRRSEGRE
jgi:hypothetical protein